MKDRQLLKTLLFPLIVVRRQYLKYIPALLDFCVRQNWPRLAAFLFWLTIRKIKSAGSTPEKPVYNIFLLRKDIFNEDARASFGEVAHVRLYEVSRRLIKRIAYHFLPRYLTDEQYYSRTPEDDIKKQAYRQFLLPMWATLRRFTRIDAVLTANFGYHAEQELAGALEHLGIPFIALHKENLKTPKIAELYAESCLKFRTPFSGRQILVYNEIERRAQIAGKIISAEQVVTTGVPRFDRIHALRQSMVANPPQRGTRPKIVFFFFTGIPHPRDWYQYIEWTDLLFQTLQAVVEAACQNPESEVIVKTKAAKILHLDVLDSMLARMPALPENAQIIRRGDPLQLIIASDVVCGFNTTAILDALALDKPAVIPHFAEAARPDYQPFIVDYEDAVEYAASPQELTAKLLQRARTPHVTRQHLPPNVVRILEKWMGNGDGRAAERVRREIFATIDKNIFSKKFLRKYT